MTSWAFLTWAPPVSSVYFNAFRLVLPSWCLFQCLQACAHRVYSHVQVRTVRSARSHFVSISMHHERSLVGRTDFRWGIVGCPFLCRCNGVVVVSACMAAAVGLAALADGWAVESSAESDDGLEAQAASRPRKRGRPPGKKRTLPPRPAITAIVSRQKFVNLVALELRDVLAGTPSFSGLDLVTSVLEASQPLSRRQNYVLVDHFLGGGVRP